jgi:hypothetical protein
MQYTFDLHLDLAENDMRYKCRACQNFEYGGSIPNPGLFGRMRAHMRELHDVPMEAKYHITYVEVDAKSAEVTFDPREADENEGTDSEAPPETAASSTAYKTEWMPRRKLLQFSFLVDTNCVNAKQKLEAMNQLEAWAGNELITLLTAKTAQDEMLTGGNAERAAKAYTFIFTESAITTESERRLQEKIETILFPGGAADSNQKNDVEIVFNSAKYMRPLITNDGGSNTQPGGILGNRAKLADLGISVIRPEEAVAQIRDAIAFRDESALRMAELMGVAAPDWIGKD